MGYGVLEYTNSAMHNGWCEHPRLYASVRQLLSLYLRFYKVTMLESTNATDEGRMRMYV